MFALVMMAAVSCGGDDDNLSEGNRYPVAESELTPTKGKLFYLWGEYTSNNFRQYYCLYHLVTGIDPSLFSTDIPTEFPMGFKGAWDGNKKETVLQRGFSYTFTNSILSITFNKDKSTEVLKVQKAQNRPLQNGDKIYLNDSPFTVQIEYI